MESKHNKIEVVLRKLVIDDPEYKAFREKTTSMRVLGLRLPVLQLFVRDGVKFANKTEIEILKIWDHLWKTSRIHEVLYLPLFYYRNHKQILGRYEWNVMKRWIERVENWEHSDALSYLYSILLERFPKTVLPVLKKWNKSKNPWKQRASIVSLIYYASPKRKAPPVSLVFELVEPLIASRDKYVCKAVGWTLRESFKLYPHETFVFIKKHVRDLSSDSFSYATEKVTGEQKIELKRIRSKR